MQLQLLKVSACYESETNPRGTEFEGKSFDELVASIKQKGVLVPVLVRNRPKAGTPSKAFEKQYEVIAGNRRLRAAKQAGLEEIPAQLVEMTDDQAAEAQIVENLQRADIHPLEEGEAYRKLIEDGGRSVKDVAVKVGKSEQYVRQRLFLTNLSDKARKAYRSGDMADSVAVLVARLTPNNQDLVLKDAGPYRLEHADDMKEYITEEFSEPLKNQPWLKDREAMAAVGPCKECPPPRAALFGEAKDGACTDLKCCLRKMKAYFAWRIKQNPELVLVSTMYGKSEAANIISQGQYVKVKKDACDYATQALIAEGSDIGSLIWVCFDKECRKHRKETSEYKPSDKERENRKKEREREDAKREKFDNAVFNALDKVKFPLSEKQLDALLDIVLFDTGTSFLMPICRRHELKADKTKDGRDYAAPLRRLAEEGGNAGKLRMIFELHLDSYSSWNDGGIDAEKKKLIAKL